MSIALLGPFELKRSNSSLRLPKKAQALLAYLAMSPGRPLPRDQLGTLLWEDSGTEQARQSLRQCLVALRDALGPAASHALIADTSSVQFVARDDIVVDVDRFVSLSSSNDLEDLDLAGTLYRDELLAGLHVPADGFGRWLAIERERFSSIRLDLLQRIGEAQAGAGNMDRAIAAARQLTTLDPLREEGHRLLMQLLAMTGQRNAALQHYEHCARLLREELGVTPDTETAQLAAAVRSGSLSSPIVRVTSASSPTPRHSDREKHDLQAPDNPSIVVLPFINLTGDAGRDYFIEGLVEDITVALGHEKWLFVIASPSTRAFRDGVDPREVGAKLGVRYVLRGSVRIDADQVLFVVQLFDVARGRYAWSGRFEDRIDNVLALQERLTTKVAATIAPALMSAEVERAQHKATENLTAFDLYLQALPRFRKSVQDNHQALTLLYKAIELDPFYAAAYGMAARCFQFQKMFDWRSPRDPAFEEGVRLARRAAEAGRDDSEALWMAGLALVHLAGEIEHSLAMVDRSLTLNANSANAWMASCLIRSYLCDSETAIDHFNRAQRLNPLDMSQHLHWNIVAWAYISADRYEQAAEAAERTVHVQPSYLPGLRLSVSTCGFLGRLDEGRTHLKRLLALQPSYSITWMRDFLAAPLQHNPALLQKYLDSIRLVGAPE